MKPSEQIKYEQRIQLTIAAYQNDDWNVSRPKEARQDGIAESTLRDSLKAEFDIGARRCSTTLGRTNAQLGLAFMDQLTSIYGHGVTART